MFTAISMTPAEMKQGLVLRFADSDHKFELIHSGKTFQLNSVRWWGASLEDPIDVKYDAYNGCFVGTYKGVIDSVFASSNDTLPAIINKFYESEKIFKELSRID